MMVVPLPFEVYENLTSLNLNVRLLLMIMLKLASKLEKGTSATEGL